MHTKLAKFMQFEIVWRWVRLYGSVSVCLISNSARISNELKIWLTNQNRGFYFEFSNGSRSNTSPSNEPTILHFIYLDIDFSDLNQSRREIGHNSIYLSLHSDALVLWSALFYASNAIDSIIRYTFYWPSVQKGHCARGKSHSLCHLIAINRAIVRVAYHFSNR